MTPATADLVRRVTTTVTLALAVVAVTAGCSSAAAPSGVDQGRSLRSPRCVPAALSATLSGRDDTALPASPAPESAGAALLAVVFTNEGRSSCVLQGWPSARLSAHGRAFGPEALQIRAVPSPAVTLRPGKRAQVYIALHTGTDAYGCDVVAPDALAVTVPHSDSPLSAGLPPDYLGDACRSTTATLIGVEAVLPL